MVPVEEIIFSVGPWFAASLGFWLPAQEEEKELF
jgi:hypothetical protein